MQWASLRRKLAAAFAEFQVPYVCLEATSEREPQISGCKKMRSLRWKERFDASNNPVLHSFWERDDALDSVCGLGPLRKGLRSAEVVASFQGAPLESTEGPKVLLLSLQDAASGTNLTRASLCHMLHALEPIQAFFSHSLDGLAIPWRDILTASALHTSPAC